MHDADFPIENFQRIHTWQGASNVYAVHVSVNR